MSAPRQPAWSRAAAWFGLALLYVPMIAVAVFSFNASRHGFVWRGFTLDWYARLAGNEAILRAARNTLALAVVSTAIATPLGTALAIGQWRRSQYRVTRAGVTRAIDLAVYLPVVTPDIIFAAALVIAFTLLRRLSPVFNPGLPAMIVAHVTFQIGFVALLVRGRLASLDPSLEEAARDLYAEGWTLTRRFHLPLLMPGVMAGALLAFTLSLDDFIISFFTSGPDSTTLPILIYASARRGVTPEIHALSFLIFILNLGLVFGLERLMRFGFLATEKAPA